MSPGQQAVGTLTNETVIGQCRIDQFLGQGGMGEVYLAEDIPLGRRVALKIVRADAATPENLERFLREARLASRIIHPNVVTIFKAGQQDGRHYIVMQYVEGQTLYELTKSRGASLPWVSAVRIIRMAARGLHEVHENGLIHRDVTPRNIMLSFDSHVRLMDFGLAREQKQSDLTNSMSVVGTPPFMSPEQCRGEPLNRQSDIYSLGTTLYYLLTAQSPFRGQPLSVVAEVAHGSRPVPIGQINQDVPHDLCRIVDRLISVDRNHRPRDARVVSRELGSVIKKQVGGSEEVWDTVEVSGAMINTISVPVRPMGCDPPASPQASNAHVAHYHRGQPGKVSANEPAVLITPVDKAWPESPSRKLWILLVPLLAVLLLLGYGVSGLRRDVQPMHREGMVFIEGGYARMSNAPEKVRDFFKQFTKSTDRLDSLVDMVKQETIARVDVEAFWIDQYEVTNAQFAEFLVASGRRPPETFDGTSPPAGKEDHPVVDITYDDAQAYAAWCGKKLPTREQWMRAFRGDHDWLFPWGDTYDATRANVPDNPRSPARSTTPVKATPEDVSQFGVYNLVGNASEFVRGTFQRRGRAYRVGKGAEFNKLPGFFFGVASTQYLYGLDISDKAVGFRCVVEETFRGGD